MRRTLYVARHGETDWNVAKRWQGQSDIPLNDHGRHQARALAGRLRGMALSAIVSSPLSRARETAEIVGAELGLTLAYVDVDLRERGFGCFEGLTRDECEARFPDAWRAWQSDHIPPRGGELADHLVARTTVSIDRAALHAARDGVPALVITHGGAMRAIVNAATGHRPAPIENTEIWQVDWDGRLVGAHVLDLDGERVVPPLPFGASSC